MGTIDRRFLKPGLGVKSGITRFLARRYCIDLGGKNAVLVAGSGRSGTSWLANICNANNEFRYLFEPLNPDTSDAVIRIENWYMSPGCEDRQATEIKKIVLGDVNSRWISSRNNRIVSHRRLIKEIRANLMLPWFNYHLPWLKIVLMLRNPMSVASSRKRLSSAQSNWAWSPTLAEMLGQPQIRALLSDEEQAAVCRAMGAGVALETIGEWCVTNLVLSRIIDLESEVHVVYYENLVTQPDKVTEKLFGFLGLDHNQGVLDAVHKRSETSRRLEHELATDQPLNDWKVTLTAEETARAKEMLTLFGVGRLYNEHWEPSLSNGKVFITQ